VNDVEDGIGDASLQDILAALRSNVTIVEAVVRTITEDFCSNRTADISRDVEAVMDRNKEFHTLRRHALLLQRSVGQLPDLARRLMEFFCPRETKRKPWARRPSKQLLRASGRSLHAGAALFVPGALSHDCCADLRRGAVSCPTQEGQAAHSPVVGSDVDEDDDATSAGAAAAEEPAKASEANAELAEAIQQSRWTLNTLAWRLWASEEHGAHDTVLQGR